MISKECFFLLFIRQFRKRHLKAFQYVWKIMFSPVHLYTFASSDFLSSLILAVLSVKIYKTMFSVSCHPLPFHTDNVKHVNINLSAEGSSLFSPVSCSAVLYYLTSVIQRRKRVKEVREWSETWNWKCSAFGRTPHMLIHVGNWSTTSVNLLKVLFWVVWLMQGNAWGNIKEKVYEWILPFAVT